MLKRRRFPTKRRVHRILRVVDGGLLRWWRWRKPKHDKGLQGLRFKPETVLQIGFDTVLDCCTCHRLSFSDGAFNFFRRWSRSTPRQRVGSNCSILLRLLDANSREIASGTMMDLLFNGVGWTDIALTLNRIAVGAFFML